MPGDSCHVTPLCNGHTATAAFQQTCYAFQCLHTSIKLLSVDKLLLRFSVTASLLHRNEVAFGLMVLVLVLSQHLVVISTLVTTPVGNVC